MSKKELRKILMVLSGAGVICIIIMVLILISLGPKTCEARVLWEDDEFVLESGAWIDKDSIAGWTGVLCRMAIPEDGWFMIEGEGAIELYIPTKGWVKDKGILVNRECMVFGDTKYKAFCLVPEHGCDAAGGLVTFVVKLPKFYPTNEDRPTDARWVQRKVDYYAAD